MDKVYVITVSWLLSTDIEMMLLACSNDTLCIVDHAALRASWYARVDGGTSAGSSSMQANSSCQHPVLFVRSPEVT